MASKQSTVDFILNHIGDEVSEKKMFGEYGIFCEGKMVAMVCDDRLLVKPTLAGVKFIGKYTEAIPYPGAKPCFLIPVEKWTDGVWLTQLIRITAAELPQPKRKK